MKNFLWWLSILKKSYELYKPRIFKMLKINLRLWIEGVFPSDCYDNKIIKNFRDRSSLDIISTNTLGIKVKAFTSFYS